MRRLFLTVLVLFALSACQTEVEPDETTNLAPVGSEVVERERQQCQAKGGTFGRGGLANTNICFTTPKDANKFCNGLDDCEGLCLARSRTCAPLVPLFGCNEVIVQPGQTATICVD
jgi:hypothetical protein